MGCLLLPFYLIIRFFKWVFSSGWKGLVVLGLIAAVIGLGYCTIQGKLEPPEDRTDKVLAVPTIPSKEKAPYIAYTTSRYYYVASYEQDGENYILNGFWTLIGREWVYREQMTLTPQFKPEIKPR